MIITIINFEMNNLMLICEAIELKAKVYVCYTCYTSFNKKQNRDVHCLTHMNIKPFLCDICDKKFSRKSNLKRHSICRHKFHQTDLIE